MEVGQLIHTIQEGQYLSIVFQKADDRFVKSSQLLVLLVTPWVMRRTAVKHIASTIATLILRDTFLVREGEYADYKKVLPLYLPLRERSNLLVLFTLFWKFLTQAAKHVQQVRIVETVKLEQLTQVLNGRRNGVDEVLLTFEIAAETIGTQHLQRTEEHKE